MYNKVAIAKRYSKALFDVCIELDVLKEVKKDFAILKELIKEFKITNFFKKSEQSDYCEIELSKIFCSDEIYKFHKIVQNLIRLLLQNQRMTLLKDIVEEFFSFVNKFEKKEKVIIETAHKLDKEDQMKFITKIENDLGNNFYFEFTENESCIGGYKIILRSKVIDATIKNRIERLSMGIRL